MFRNLLLAAVASAPVALSASAAFANGPWTGIYGGIGGGFSSATHEIEVSDGPALPPGLFTLNLDGLGGDGGFFTLGVGGDYQINSVLVVGGFFDYDWTDVETSADLNVLGFNANASFEIEDQWSIGGRIGFLPNEKTMLFVTGGYTQVGLSDLSFSTNALGAGVLASVDDDPSGFFIGGGAEILLTDALSIKGEYRYTDLRTEDVTLLPGQGALTTLANDFVDTTIETDIHAARLTLNYRFNFHRTPAAVVPMK